MSQFGFASSGITAADLQTPKSIIQLGVKPNRIDLLTAVSGVSFDEAWFTRKEAELDGISTQYIGLGRVASQQGEYGSRERSG